MKVYQYTHSASKGWQNPPNVGEWDSENTLVLAFCSPMYRDQPEILAQLQAEFPKSKLTGCSTSGELYGKHLQDLSAVITVVKFDHSRIQLANGDLESFGGSVETGRKLAEQLKSDDLKGVLVLSDGLNVNGSSLIEGINSVFPDGDIVISGGLAGDGNRFEQTWVINEGAACSGWVSLVGFYGSDISMACSSHGGWDQFGPERIITQSQGNVLYKIDDRPALDIYKEYLGEKAKELPAAALLFPLQVRPLDNPDHKLVRTILNMDEESKSITFAGDVPEGWRAQLMRANFNRVIDGANDASEVVHQKLAEQLSSEGELDSSLADSSFTVAISCVGRRLVLGERSEEEIEAVYAGLGENAKLSGFYSYGELGPYARDKPCDLHNQTMTVLTIIEKMVNTRKQVA